MFKTSTNLSIPNASIVLLKKLTSLKLAKNGQFLFSMQIIEFPSEQNNEMLLTEFIICPCKYELRVRIEVVFNEAILHRSSS